MLYVDKIRLSKRNVKYMYIDGPSGESGSLYSLSVNERSEIRSKRSEIRSKRSEIRSKRSEIRSKRSEIRSKRSEIRSKKE